MDRARKGRVRSKRSERLLPGDGTNEHIGREERSPGSVSEHTGLRCVSGAVAGVNFESRIAKTSGPRKMIAMATRPAASRERSVIEAAVAFS